MSWQELPLDRVYFDSVTGVPGQTWPIGTPTVPSDVIADVIAMCTARNLRVIDVHGLLTLGNTMEHYTFIGHRHEAVADTLALAGQDVDESIIIGCLVSGAQGGTGFLTLENCIVYLLTDFQGIANYCDLYGSAMSLKNAGYQDLHHCNSVHSDLTITVNAPTRASFKEMAGNCQFTAQTGGELYIRGYKGTLIINAMTGGTLDIYANGADITINANCDAPSVISIYGNARVTIVGAPTATIHDYTKETQLDAIETDVATVDTVVDAIKLVTDQLPDGGALTALLNNIASILTDTDTTIPGLLATIQADLDNPDQYKANVAALALEASITALDAVVDAGFLAGAKDATVAKEATLTTHDTALTAAKAVIDAIKLLLDTPANFMADVSALALEATLGTHDTDIKALLATIAGYIDTEVAAILAAVDTEVAAIETKLDTPANFMADLTTLETRLSAARALLLDEITALRMVELDAANIPGDIDGLKTSRDSQLFTMDFWSLPQEEVALTGAAGDKGLPSVTVADLPGDATIVRAIAMFKFRMVENHTYAGVNSLDGAQEIQVAASVDAINFVNTQFTLAQDTREGGDVIIGVIDIAATVNANGAYAFHWDLAKALQTGINFNDVQMGIRIWYSV